jgi:hypothetical protein
VPRGIYSITKPNEIGLNKEGVLFCFSITVVKQKKMWYNKNGDEKWKR